MPQDTRKDPRAKVLTMTVRYKSATIDEFIEHHSHDVSRGGMYIKTPQPFPPGTLLKFEVKIAADQRLMQGVGRVVWRREADEASADHPAGMGVKFIKLDEGSKGIIDQLVTARMGDISAFDEVDPQAELPQGGASEPPNAGMPKSDSSEGFFPKSNDNVPQPAPEDRTVMKQATELLQEALREVGEGSAAEAASAPQDVIPKAPKTAAVSSSVKTARPAAEAPEQTPRYQRIPTPIAAAAASAESRAASAKAATSEPSIAKRREPPVSPKFEPSAPTAASRPITDAAPKTVPASPMAARRGPAAPALKAGEDESPLPAKQAAPPNRGLRVALIALLVGGAAAAVLVMTRKPAPRPIAPEPAVTAAAPPVVNVPPAQAIAVPAADAAAASSATAVPEAASAAPPASAETPTPAEKPAVVETPKAEPAVKPRVIRHKKVDAGTPPPPPLDKADDLTPTPPPAKTSGDSTGTTDSTPAPSPKSKPKPAAPTPAPTLTEEAPL